METSAPWSGTSLGDSGPFSDSDWAAIWRDICNAAKADEGPLMGSGVSPDPGLTVQATGPASASVNVTAGSALVDGRWYNSSATVNLPIDAEVSGNPRIDTIVLRRVAATQTIRLAVLKGAPNVAPTAPALTTTAATWEIPLADIAVANGFVTIVAGNITPNRHWANAADGVYLRDILNNSGALLEHGQVCVWDTTADRAVKTSNVAGGDVAGIWQGRSAAGSYGRVMVRGITQVYVDGAVAARGARICKSATVKQATVSVTGKSFAKSLEITGGAGLCLCYVDVGQHSPGVVMSVVAKGADSDTTSDAFSDVDAAVYKIAAVANTTRQKVTMSFMGGMLSPVAACLPEYDILRVGGSRAGHATHGLGSGMSLVTGAYVESPITLEAIFTGLVPGTNYEYRLQYRNTVNTKHATVFGSLGEVCEMMIEDI